MYAKAHEYAVRVKAESLATYPTAPARMTRSEKKVSLEGRGWPRKTVSAIATRSGVRIGRR